MTAIANDVATGYRKEDEAHYRDIFATHIIVVNYQSDP